MNAVLQQLFHVPELRYGVLSAAPHSEERGVTKGVLYELSKLFCWLENSERQFIVPSQFCGSFTDQSGNIVDPAIQMDASEFFIGLCEQLDTHLNTSTLPKLLPLCIAGATLTSLTCPHCKSKTSTSEVFYTLSLDTKGHSSLQAALDAHVQSEYISDYKCTGCKQLVTVEKKCSIESLGETLVIHLKR